MKLSHSKGALQVTFLTLDQTEAKILNEDRNIIFTWDPMKESYVISEKAPKTLEVLFEV